MKSKITFCICATVFALAACKDDDAIKNNHLPVLQSSEIVTDSWNTRSEYEFNENGTLARVDWRRETPTVTQGADAYSYDDQGRVKEMIRSITGVADEKIEYRLETDQVFMTNHYLNTERLSYMFYEYNEKGQLMHMDVSNRVGSGIGYLRGNETDFSYYDDGNLFQVKEYSFEPQEAKLHLETVKTYSE